MSNQAQVTSASQTTAKNDTWVAVTVKVEKDDGSTSQTLHIEPRGGKR